MPKKNHPSRVTYRSKRAPGRTTEPFAGAGALGIPRFVIHHHEARRHHFDLRLEVGGTLRSWAVPRGPSPDPEIKRLAVRVEDHPLSYATYEGVIPEGNYGAGAMIVWDWGPLEWHDDPEHGEDKGKLLFSLWGHKARGLWTLVKGARADKEWLLIKKPDGLHRTQEHYEEPARSLYSGLATSELLNPVPTPAAPAPAGFPPIEPPADYRPMLAKAQSNAFDNDGWCFEPKLDGFRLGAHKRGGDVTLLFRSGREATHHYPELVRALSRRPEESLSLDGEVVVLGKDGRPIFHRLHARTERAAESAQFEHPITFYAFDCLAYEGCDLRRATYKVRRTLLEQIVPELGLIRRVASIPKTGLALLEEIHALGFEGIVAKKASSPYLGKRSDLWLKIRLTQTETFTVLGYTPEKREPEHVGALLLGHWTGSAWQYCGRVGTGFRNKEREDLFTLLRKAADLTFSPPQADDVPKDSVWTGPVFGAVTTFKDRTATGLLRHPRFQSIDPNWARPTTQTPPKERRPWPELSNPDKLLWTEPDISKRELRDYYRAIAPWMLPYTRGRPLVLDRYPDGVHNDGFFQKYPAEHEHPEIVSTLLWSEEDRGNRQFFTADVDEALSQFANLAAIVIHGWSSRAETPGQPDWCVLDLDPKDAPFTNVTTIARALHQLCDACSIPNFVKTSGSSGLHVLIPLGRRYSHDQSKDFAMLLALIVIEQHSDIATVVRTPDKREGKVYIDTYQNGAGKLLVLPYSVRPLPNAPVSMPLRWHEVNRGLHPRKFTMKNALARVKRKPDPMAPVLGQSVDLPKALAKLSELRE